MNEDITKQNNKESTDLNEINKSFESWNLYKINNCSMELAKIMNCDATVTTSQTDLEQTIIVDYWQNLYLPHPGSE